MKRLALLLGGGEGAGKEPLLDAQDGSEADDHFGGIQSDRRAGRGLDLESDRALRGVHLRQYLDGDPGLEERSLMHEARRGPVALDCYRAHFGARS